MDKASRDRPIEAEFSETNGQDVCHSILAVTPGFGVSGQPHISVLQAGWCSAEEDAREEKTTARG
jgi:hypothetical protein